MFGGSDNLIVITPDAVAAAIVRGGRVQTWHSQPRDPNADLVMAVEASLDLLASRLGRTWIVAADLWSQPVGVQTSVARRVPADRLAQFLCFEVEPLSGIAARSGQAGVVALAGTDSESMYWVTEIDRTLFEQIESLVQSRGGRLAGLLHPAGAPAPVQPGVAVGTAWWRIESWQEMIVCIAGLAGKETSRRVFPRSGLDSDWQVQAQGWLDQLPAAQHGEVLDFSGLPLPSLRSSTRPLELSLVDPTLWKSWIDACAATLARRNDVPTILPGRRPMSSQTKRLLVGGAAAAAVLGCFAHLQTMSVVNRMVGGQVQGQIAALTGPTAQAKAAEQEITKLTDDVKSLTGKHEALAAEILRFRAAAQSQQERMPRLLQTLSDVCGPEVLIHEIESERDQMRLVGRCVDGRQANAVAHSLARELAELGLTVSTPNKTAQNWFRDGTPHEFELTITDGDVAVRPPSFFEVQQ